MKIIIMGAQGSGKGTQGELLAEKMGCEFVSLGDLLREDPVVRAKLADGELLNDAEVDGIALAKLKGGSGSETENLVFDGYPRRKSQAETLVREGVLPDMVLEIVVPEEELVWRMLLRGREDDTEVAIRRRLEQYYAERDAVMEVLKAAGVRVVQVDGVGGVEEIHERILAKIG